MPLNIVFAGPTGSGKSTLINSVAGRWVTEPGVLRPTTTHPLIYSHSDHRSQLVSDIQYDLVTGASPILESLTLIDTPDLDSTNLENRARAMDAISRADVVVFVSSALRYSDLVPWEVFRDVAARGVPIIFALNRISTHTSGVVTDFRRRARSEGMSMRVVRVEEHQIGGGVLPAASVRELRRAIVSCVPSESEATDRIENGVEYVMDELVEMRRGLEAKQELLLKVRDEFDRSLSFPNSFNAEMHRQRWLGDVDRVPWWVSRSRWMPAYQAVRDDLVTEIALAMEQDLHLIARKGSQIEVDLSESSISHEVTAPSKAILMEWMGEVEPRGDLAVLSRSRARDKVLNAIAAVTNLLSDLSDHPSASISGAIGSSNRHKTENENVDNAATDLRHRIDDIYQDAVTDLESLSFAREFAAIDSLIDSARVGITEPIVANA